MAKLFAEITKEINFEAAHYLHHPKWDRAKNIKIFKKCSGFRADNPKASHFPHGHSYRLQVTVKGSIDPQTGFVMDFKVLKDILNREIMDHFDHRFINMEVSPFKENPLLQTTVENLLKVMWERLSPVIRKQGVVLSRLDLWETSSSFATYRGGK
jgi:6-pyruvoyltetrahydropterin/6-carboxytetrahydropterin synthase